MVPRDAMPNTDVAEQQERYLTPPEIAARLRVSSGKVLNWIRKAELRAINVGNGSRPRYRISPTDLEKFLKRREVAAPPPSSPRRRQEQMPDGGPLDSEVGKKLAREGKATLYGKTYYRVWNGVILFY